MDLYSAALRDRRISCRERAEAPLDPETLPREKIAQAQEAQAFAESIVDTVRGPLLVLDERLRIVTVNRAFCRAFHVLPEDTLDRLIYELGNGQWDLPELRLLLEEIVPAHSQFDDFEVRHSFPAIGQKIMLLNARKLYRPGNNTTMLLLAIEDVTERRMKEQALEASEAAARAAQEFYATTLSSIGDAVITTNSQGQITFLNPVAEALTGWAIEEAIGRDHKDVFNIVNGNTQLPVASPVTEVLHGGGISGLGNHTVLLRKDGSQIAVGDSGAPIRSPDGHLFGAILVFQDITERRAAEAQLQASYERERRIAEALQRPVMREVPEDAFAGLSVATLYQAVPTDTAQVGGDFFDAFSLTEGRTAFLLGDVTGHGLPATARATEVKDVLRAFLRLDPFSPSVTLTRLNDYLHDVQTLDDRAQDTLLGLSLVIVDTRTNQATFAWGGIDPPLLLKRDGTVEILEGGGVLLGVQPDATFKEVTISLLPGEGFLLHTDGLSEARRGRSFLDQEGVIELARAAQEESTVRNMATAILHGVQAFVGGALRDDACIVIVKRPDSPKG